MFGTRPLQLERRASEFRRGRQLARRRALCLLLPWLALNGGCSSRAPAPAASGGAAASTSGRSAADGGSGGSVSAGATARIAAAGSPAANSGSGAAAADAGASSPGNDDAGTDSSLHPVPMHVALDPNIVFQWEETQPGTQTATDCKAGRYEGTFTCTYLMPGADPSTGIEVTGPVVFELTRSQNGEFLEISQGQLEGFAALLINFTASLTGKLNCSTNSLDAAANQGMFGFGSAALLPAGAFAGSLTGTLDRTTTTLSGQWNLMLTDGLAAGGACIGPWTAQWVP
jgi:hypothetical protein